MCYAEAAIECGGKAEAVQRWRAQGRHYETQTQDREEERVNGSHE